LSDTLFPLKLVETRATIGDLLVLRRGQKILSILNVKYRDQSMPISSCKLHQVRLVRYSKSSSQKYPWRELRAGFIWWRS